jgi:hypothetical protein
LKKIAAHKEINDWQYREILPDARRTLYAISKLNSRLFSLALQEGMIHPRVTAEEIEQWYRRKLGVREPHPLKLTIRPKKTLDQRGSEEEPDENERDKLVSKLRREMDAIGFSVSDRPIAEKRHGD